MKLPGYYSSGEFAKKAHITKKTVRYYDEHNILKPSYVNENGARFYNDDDFARLQQILFLKYLGFSLDDIKEMTLRNTDSNVMSESLHMQLGLVEERIEQMKLMKSALQEASEVIDEGRSVDWSHMLELVNINEMEQKLKQQYRDASNISARINLHRDFSMNPVSWFSWVFDECSFFEGEKVLEVGCGDASLWTQNIDRIPADMQITLTDISYGMVRDATRNVGADDKRFTYEVMDAHRLYKPDASYDCVIADHVLFYCDNLDAVCSEIQRVLKPGGVFVCSTYSSRHMKEINDLVQEFDDRIELSYRREESVNLQPTAQSFTESYNKKIKLTLEKDFSILQETFSQMVESSDILVAHADKNPIIVEIMPWLYQFKLLGETGNEVLAMVKAYDKNNQSLPLQRTPP